ncbi:hypothetical protein ACI2OX_18815 [Bacillus sp. N9]
MILMAVDFKDREVLIRNESSEVLAMSKTIDIEEIEKALGIDKIKPISLTPSDSEDSNEKTGVKGLV